MLSQLRQARYGYLLGLHILLLCAAGYMPTAIAACLFCSRSSVYRAVDVAKGALADDVAMVVCPAANDRITMQKRSPPQSSDCKKRDSTGRLSVPMLWGSI
jgi:hypothetical protein